MEQAPKSIAKTEHERQIDFDRLVALGLFLPQPFGIQIDLNVVNKKTANEDGTITEGNICDHNCTLKSESNPHGGGYACPAANSLPENKGLDIKSFAPLEDVLQGIHTATEGLQALMQAYLKRLAELGYPTEVIEGIASQPKKPGINEFGGNPEMYPEIHAMNAQLTQEGYTVTLTTTCKKIFLSPEFVRKLEKNPPTRIALSADDLPTDPAQIRKLATLSEDDLRQVYRKISPQAGQAQKAIEAIGTLTIAQDREKHPNFPDVMVNFVIHRENIDSALEMMQTLGNLYPDVMINPYPAQSAFANNEPIFTPEQVVTFGKILDIVIARHFEQLEGPVDFKVVPRLFYYLRLKAIYNAYPDDLEKISKVLSGDGLWKCYEEPLLTGRYLQIGKAAKPLRKLLQIDGRRKPGGHLGCFWNAATVTNSEITVWDANPQEITEHITSGMQQLANASEDPCKGCGFPRLLTDTPSVFAGIPGQENNPEWEQLRILYQQYAGF